MRCVVPVHEMCCGTCMCMSFTVGAFLLERFMMRCVDPEHGMCCGMSSTVGDFPL